MNFTESANALQPYLIKIRRAIHQHPELSGQEKNTSELVIKELEAAGCFNIRKHIAGYGVAADLTGALPGPVIALRADMDALPVTEKTGLPFASENPGVMHACGHDLHTTMLLGAAKILAEHREELAGTVRFIFQPAEEDPALKGSEGMIEEGALEGVSAIFGMHCWPELPAGTFGIRAGKMMAAMDHFLINIRGIGAHGAQPHMGKDALFAGCQFVQNVQQVVGRNVDPFDPAVITIGQFEAGSKYNVIAESCRLEGTIRTYSPEVRDLVNRRLKEVLDGVCLASGCTGELINISSHPAVINDKELAERLADTAAGVFGAENVIHLERPTSISEDYSWYGKVVPSVFGFIGVTKPGDPVRPLHSCDLSPDEEVMKKGVELFCRFAAGFA